MSKTPIETYLFFDGTCEEAMAFYREKLGASVEFIMRYKEAPEAPPPGRIPAGWENKIMHASLLLNDTRIMASDDCTGGSKTRSGFALVLSTATEVEADHAFTALSDGGKVSMPLSKTFFSPKFGMLTDKFGIMWMVMVQSQER
jgi:PhnB protein